MNVQGCRNEVKKQFIYEDTLKYSLQIIGLTETHISKEEISTNKNISIKKAKIQSIFQKNSGFKSIYR